jgi:serine/threonine protein kinase
VFTPGPDWWVKIGDFGISKRAEEGSTALRTLVGTRGYLAPEVIGVYATQDATESDRADASYTFAVDIWALGEITFRLVANVAAFPHPRDLFNYVVGGRSFPRTTLEKCGASMSCCDFVETAMAGSPRSRPSAQNASEHTWLALASRSSFPPEDGSVERYEECLEISARRDKLTILAVQPMSRTLKRPYPYQSWMRCEG